MPGSIGRRIHCWRIQQSRPFVINTETAPARSISLALYVSPAGLPDVPLDPDLAFASGPQQDAAD